MQKHPIFANTHEFYDADRHQIHLNWMKKINFAHNLNRSYFFNSICHPLYTAFVFHQGQTPVLLHQTMFCKSLEAFSTDEQREKWLSLAINYNIHGCYAQTEIGHGSNVAGLETTATFDKETDEFVLDMPSISATKWWPGELGTMANFALVFAQLIIEDDGEKNNYGVAPFLVQIRDRETHKHMPGVKTGDMGPKFGYHGKDNGWMTLNKVRIPRD